jgi:LmbE family N-acetylglucosaminyl deacetylase
MITMSFVAHQDDDLLFMNPDAASDIGPGNEVWIVYLTAGNLTPGAGGMPYADKRIQGARAAWARAAHRPNSWNFELLTVNGRQLATNTLNGTGGKVRLVHTFINAANGADDGDLSRMWDSHAFVASPIDGRASYTYSTFLAMLKALIGYANPEFIRVQDTQGFQCGDHIDHVHGARFAMTANLGPGGTVLRRADEYFDYIITNFAANWAGSGWAEEKLSIWNQYKPFDNQLGPTSWDNVADRQHRRRVLDIGDTWSADEL